MPKDDVIAALEKATGPDRELDRAIVDAVRGKPKPGFQHGRIERFTASIDAALTLVPEGWTRDVDATAPEMGIAVTLHEPKGGPDGKRAIGDHASEAIATCIAALRATERGEAGR